MKTILTICVLATLVALTAALNRGEGIYYKFLIPNGCPTAARTCCPNNCNAATSQGSCKAINIDPKYAESLTWFTQNFTYACICSSEYTGADCGACNFGFKKNPTTNRCERSAVTAIRRDWKTMTTAQKNQYFDVIKKAMDTTSTEGSTVIDVYHYHALFHWWVNQAYLSDSNNPLPFPNNDTAWTWGHGGPSFIPWHRLYMLRFERALQILANDDTFGLPYWNWIDQSGKEDSIFTDFGGVTEDATCLSTCGCPVTSGPFGNRRIFGHDGVDEGPIKRAITCIPGSNSSNWKLPTSGSVATTLSQAKFYDESMNGQDFTSIIEGDTPLTPPSCPSLSFTDMHTLVHLFVGGTMGIVRLAANDPLFWLHHNFIDYLYEKYIIAHGEPAPWSSNVVGQDFFEPTSPFFPLYRNADYVKRSQNYGYYFDTFAPSTMTSGASPITLSVVAVLAAVLFLLF